MQADILIDFIKQENGKVLLYKGEDELLILKNWLDQKDCSSPVKNNSNGKIISTEVTEVIKNCNKCENSINKKYPVGRNSSSIMIILNSPILIGQGEKRLYREDSVALLKQIISAINLDIKETYITNLVKCDASSSITSPGQMIKNCEEILQKEIDFIKPEIIIFMGEMKFIRTIILSYKNIFWFNVDHPITLLKNKELKRKTWETLKLVIKKVEELNILTRNK